MSKNATALTVITLALLCGCTSREAPPCHFSGDPAIAPSAGCFSVVEHRLLVVQGLNGAISLPGGSSFPGETAQCTAARETWEETGLSLEPGPRLATFATGFHLYECRRDADSGAIDPPPGLEVRRAFYLHVDEFDQWQWRYPEQAVLLSKLIAALDTAPQAAAAEPETTKVR